MLPLKELQGKNLGEKHKYLNSLVQDAYTDTTSHHIHKTAEEKSTIDRLFKIDLALKCRDVDYIVETLKSDDILYVNRALKATWLITDDQYAHIINPEHLYTVLFPQMYNKAICKLKLNIRLHLRSEGRCQQFYAYHHSTLKDIPGAFKFLPYCSEEFIGEILCEITEWPQVNNEEVLKRICERFPNFADMLLGKFDTETANRLVYSLNFIATTHTELYCDLLEKYASRYCHKFSKHFSKTLIEQYEERIFEHYDVYLHRLHLDYISKLWPEDKIVQLIEEVCQDDRMESFGRDELKKITKRMKPERREELLNEYRPLNTSQPEELHIYTKGRGKPKVNAVNLSMWYKDLPFDRTFTEIKQLVREASDPEDRYKLLKELISKTKDSEENLHRLLLYYYNCHINEVRHYKLSFLNALHDLKEGGNFNERCWRLVNDLFISVDTYGERNYFIYNKIIVYYNILHDSSVPENIMEKFLERDPDKSNYSMSVLNKEDKKKILEHLNKQFELKCDVLRKQVGIEKPLIDLTKRYIKFIKRCEEQLADRPYIIKLIKDIVKAKPGSIDYPKGAINRRLLFEESILMSQDKDVILNILKHDSRLLDNLNQVLEKMLCAKKMILYKRLLQKICTYFHNDLAMDMTAMFKKKLKECEENSTLTNSVTRGLSLSLDKTDFLDCIQPYKPTNYKIDWSTEDIFLVNIRKGIAQNLHHVRPLIDMDTVYNFAQGDYLQFSVPAVLSVCSALPLGAFMENVSKLLDSPVSVMRHGIRLAYSRLITNELIPMLGMMWTKSNNIKIRFVIFQAAFNTLRDEKDEQKINPLWTLLKSFIVTLNAEKDKNIFMELLTKIDSLPESIRCECCKMSYEAIKGISEKIDLSAVKDSLMRNMSQLIRDGMDADFVAKVITENFKLDMLSRSSDNWVYFEFKDIINSLFVEYIASSVDEKDRAARYEKVGRPVFKIIIENWNHTFKDDEEWSMREIFSSMLKKFARSIHNRLDSSIRNFTSMRLTYDSIEKQFENACNVQNNFKLYVKIKFLTITEECIEVISLDETLEHKYKICAKLLSDKCQQLLSYLIENNFSSLQPVFGAVLKDFVVNDLNIHIYVERDLIFHITLLDNFVNRHLNVIGFEFILEYMSFNASDETKSYHSSVIAKINKIKNDEIQFQLNMVLNDASISFYNEMIKHFSDEDEEESDEDEEESSEEETEEEIVTSENVSRSFCNIL